MTRPEGGTLEVRGLTREYGDGEAPLEILKGITFTARPGDSIAVVGPSGCGKSTLLHILGTLDRPTGGSIRFGDLDPQTLSEPELARFRNETIGFVFQDHHLLPQYSLLENVMLPALASGKPPAGLQQRAAALLESVGLAGRASHRPGEISGGERQRAAVARALVNGPALLLCDEPTGNLDQATAASVAAQIFALHRKERGILIVVTHSLELAAQCSRRLRLVEGTCSEA